MNGRPILVALVASLLAPAVLAGVDVDFGASVFADDPQLLFVSIASRYYDRDTETVATFGARFGDSDDLSVALFISRYTGHTVDDVWQLRRSGLSWWDVSVRYRMWPDVWFVPLPNKPGPPYGKAYGQWKKHRKSKRATIALADADIRNLVAVRMIHDYYGVPIETAMKWRANGRKVHVLMAEEYLRRHGRNSARR
jgi:hypothetical protein